jgi:glycosyltransferase involved in cell wall biosynthesis
MFPPAGGVGRIRPVKFIKYLPANGYKTHVLTVEKPFNALYDYNLIKEIPKNTTITRINYIEPAFWIKAHFWQSFLAYILYPFFLFPDAQIIWFLPALFKAYKITKTEKIDLIFTSSSPISDHFIAYYLSKITKIPWVADFRDEWTNNPTYKFPTPLHLFLAKIWEKKIIKQAKQVILALPKLAEYLSKINPQKKYTGINNGYDHEYFQRKVKTKKRNYCEFLFAGRLYATARDHDFIVAFNQLKLKKAKVKFLGQKKWVSHQESVKNIRQADILLLILNPSPRPAHIPSKFYEYLAAKKPILALAPRNTHVAQLIKKLKIGIVVEPRDKEAIKKAIETMYQRWEKKLLKISDIDISQYDRRNLTKKLAVVFNKATK